MNTTLLPTKIKTSITSLINTAETFIDVFEDGKVTGREKIDLVMAAFTFPQLIEDAKQALKSKAKLNPELSKEISNYFAKEFDLPNDELEVKIENAIAVLSKAHEKAMNAIKAFNELKDCLEEVKDVYKSFKPAA